MCLLDGRTFRPIPAPRKYLKYLRMQDMYVFALCLFYQANFTLRTGWTRGEACQLCDSPKQLNSSRRPWQADRTMEGAMPGGLVSPARTRRRAPAFAKGSSERTRSRAMRLDGRGSDKARGSDSDASSDPSSGVALQDPLLAGQGKDREETEWSDSEVGLAPPPGPAAWALRLAGAPAPPSPS